MKIRVNLLNVIIASTIAICSCQSSITQYEGWELVWSDEFDTDGTPDSKIWSAEQGFVRNNEEQWYQAENATCRDGLLIIEGRAESRPNPNFVEGSASWRESREMVNYTSASIHTRNNLEFLYGRLEVSAKIPTSSGSWPAIWTLGRLAQWPSGGEIDVMEFYQIGGEPHILANVACGTDKPYEARWDSERLPFSKFVEKNSDWADQFHLWRLDWDEEAIRIYLDGELLNETLLSETVNGTIGDYTNPFNHPQYILLNLAMGSNGGEILDETLPIYYEIDYVRLYKRK